MAVFFLTGEWPTAPGDQVVAPTERLRPGEDEVAGKPTTEEVVVQRMHRQFYWCLAEMARHREEAFDALLYLYAHQQYYADTPEDFQIIVNTMLPEISRKVARTLDMEPVMELRGFGSEDYDVGKAANDLLRYNREESSDRYDSWEETFLKVLFDWKGVGEGLAFFGFDPYAADGSGQVFARWVRSLLVMWDPDSRSQQHRDASFVIWGEPKSVEYLNDRYPEDAPFYPDWPGILSGSGLAGTAGIASEEDDITGASDGVGGTVPFSGRPLRALLLHRWEKRERLVTAYIDRESGVLETVARPDGIRRPLTPEQFKQISEADQKRLKATKIPQVTLWETEVANNEVLTDEVSKHDRSKKGTGNYPFAFLSNIFDPRFARAHGDVAFTQGYEDLQSQLATRWVESILVANAVYLDLVQGAYSDPEEAKFREIGRAPFQPIRRRPGMPAAAFVNSSPTSANLIANGFGFLQELRDTTSQQFKVQRGDMPYQTSGRGIGQLLAEASVADNLDRVRVKSFLRQEAILRFGLMQQNYTQPRMLRILGQTGKEEDQYILYTGPSVEATQQEFGLEKAYERGQGEKGQPQLRETDYFKDQQGRKSKILALSNEDIGKYDIRMVLTAGKESQRAEDAEIARMMLEYAAKVPPSLVRWVGDILGVKNPEGLEFAMTEANEQNRMIQQLDELLKSTGMSFDQAKEQLTMMAQAGGGTPAPGGNGQAMLPPGPPQPAGPTGPVPQEAMLV